MINYFKKRIKILLNFIKYFGSPDGVNSGLNRTKYMADSVEELLFANRFHDTIRGSVWFPADVPFSFSKGSCNYSFAYILYRILNDTHPLDILEFGLGQSSKLTSLYTLNKNKNAHLDIVEHDRDWIEAFSGNITLNDRIKIHNLELEMFEFQNRMNDKYAALEKVTGEKKYDLIIIDGPVGAQKNFPRSNILDLIPSNLAESFVIILDDAERPGEQRLLDEVFKKLNDASVDFSHTIIHSIKNQAVIVSPDLEHVLWY